MSPDLYVAQTISNAQTNFVFPRVFKPLKFDYTLGKVNKYIICLNYAEMLSKHKLHILSYNPPGEGASDSVSH